ncbi:Hypothetical protein, putative [Bodo saltans]|uniref:Uncharacterized protein n=1 Tax=Bodo saltans TaxID=75058 RepID=A0A0S4IQB7_BODSA|nr:Hypothetical protein, putative [Bodo saltans]|eukprot:CUE85819.1 Hypothetical protein, putative [Bodo saltans]
MPEEVTDTTALLRLLQEEVEHLRGSTRQKDEEIERRERDSKRTMVMMQMTHDQLSLLKDANVKLETQLIDSREKCRQLQALAQSKEEEALHAAKVLMDTKRVHEGDIKKLESLQVISEKKHQAQLSANDVLRNEIQALKARIEDITTTNESESRKRFEATVALETRLKHKTIELDDLELLREKDTRQATAREYELSKKITSQDQELRALTEQIERDRRLQFTLMAGLKSESETAAARLSNTQKQLTDAETSRATTTDRLSLECAQLKDRLEEANASHTARERVLETQVAKLCADLRVAQSEINAMADNEHSQRRGFAEALISANARGDVSKSRAEQLDIELAQMREKLRQTIVASSLQMDELKLQHKSANAKLQETVNDKSQTLQHSIMDLKVTESKLLSSEEELHRHVERSIKETNSMTAEISSLRTELDGYRNAVKKLEKHIEDNFEVRVLTEQNENLEAESKSLKERVRHANQTLADLRVEADISEGYRIKMIQEELSNELRRASVLDQERRAARELLTVLVPIAANANAMELSVLSELDKYQRLFGKL